MTTCSGFNKKGKICGKKVKFEGEFCHYHKMNPKNPGYDPENPTDIIYDHNYGCMACDGMGNCFYCSGEYELMVKKQRIAKVFGFDEYDFENLTVKIVAKTDNSEKELNVNINTPDLDLIIQDAISK